MSPINCESMHFNISNISDFKNLTRYSYSRWFPKYYIFLWCFPRRFQWKEKFHFSVENGSDVSLILTIIHIHGVFIVYLYIKNILNIHVAGTYVEFTPTTKVTLHYALRINIWRALLRGNGRLPLTYGRPHKSQRIALASHPIGRRGSFRSVWMRRTCGRRRRNSWKTGKENLHTIKKVQKPNTRK